jgi:hypothetical protein
VEIRAKQKELDAAKDQLGFLEAQERADAEAKTKADQELKDQLEAEEKQLATARVAFAAGAAKAAQQTLEAVSPGPELPLHYPAGLPPEGEVVETFPAMSTKSPAESIQEIIDQIRAVDCPTCKGGTALMVARRELAIWRTK